MNTANYLTTRHISKEVQEYSKIHSQGSGRIVIPVFDNLGNLLFNKYRKSPSNTNPKTPKYMYDKGSSFTIYGNFPGYKPTGGSVCYVEGEFDALVLQSKGIHAMTSTGGCTAFKSEWLQEYDDITICLDGDEAGRKATAKIVTTMNRRCKVKLMPEGVDASDFFMNGGTVEEFHMLPTFDYKPFDPEDSESYLKRVEELHFIGYDETITHIQEILRKEYYQALKRNEEWDLIEEKISSLEYCIDENKRKETERIDLSWVSANEWKKEKEIKSAIELANRELEKELIEYKRIRKPRTTKSKGEGWVTPEEIETANQYPIQDLMKFDKNYKALCLWHSEDTPSLSLHKEGNFVKCFGKCGIKHSAVDVYQKLNNCDFVTAVKALTQHE